ncbi:UvrD-helicase domain-containing protein [Oceanobacillus manasiensis]|uniref:UvrD-helicase domain-containing protein n=1 Tax=Oceanobacillus manasiensis TaxID=586413 RepID=UPI0005AAD22F|nr:ATP-dependent helicase [Oceanobacillus manasiensis]
MLEGLSDQQKRAVKGQGNTLVIACPGSGKTRVLTRKIAYELEKMNTRKKYVIALTYTNRAAEEVQKRIDELGISTEQLWSGTIHSFCYQWILKPYAGYIKDLKDGFQVIDEFMTINLLNQLKAQHSIPRYKSVRTNLNRYGKYSNSKAPINNLAKEFHSKLLKEKFIDFDLLLYYSYIFIKENSKVSKQLSSLFSYIFVDEFQDTQDLQYAILGEIIRAKNGMSQLFLVGDPDQAIYSSLGGIAKNKYEIEEEIGSRVNELELSGNYRSTQRIVDFFSNFQSTGLYIDSLASYAEDQGAIVLNKTINENQLYQEIAKIVDMNLKEGVKPSEICIIAPRWVFLTSISKKLKSLLPNVPFEAPGLTPLPRNADNFFFKLSRLFLSSPSPDLYMSRLRWSKQVIDSLNLYTGSAFSIENDDCRKFLKLVNGIYIDEQDGILYLEKAFSSLFIKLEIDIYNHEKLMKQWNSFFSGIQERYMLEEFEGIPNDIHYFRSMMEPSKGVVINSCHGVKGEEFETVIAFGLLWGYVPHWNEIIGKPSHEQISASNRLLYVIGSRAKKNLYLISEQGRSTFNRNPYLINHQLNNVDFCYDKKSIMSGHSYN